MPREFEIKTYADIKNELEQEITIQQSNFAENKPKLSDFSTGSIIGVITRSIAQVISSKWLYLKELSDSFYISTASGDVLKNRLQDFGFEVNTGSPASGTVQVIKPSTSSFSGIVTAGETLFVGNRQFQITTSSQPFTPNGTAETYGIIVAAIKNGEIDNLAVGQELRPTNPNYAELTFKVGTGVSGNNTTGVGLSGGTDDETDADARIRFASYIQNLGKGTLSIIQQEVNSISGVRRCKIYDNSRIVNNAIDGPETSNNQRAYPGYIVVQVMPTDTTSGLTELLKSKIRSAVENVKAAGVAYTIHSVPTLTVDLEVTIKTNLSDPSTDWTTYTGSLLTIIENHFNALDLKESLYTSILESKLITSSPDKAPGGISVKVKDLDGVQIDANGKVTPQQSGDGGVLALRAVTFVASSL